MATVAREVIWAKDLGARRSDSLQEWGISYSLVLLDHLRLVPTVNCPTSLRRVVARAPSSSPEEAISSRPAATCSVWLSLLKARRDLPFRQKGGFVAGGE